MEHSCISGETTMYIVQVEGDNYLGELANEN